MITLFVAVLSSVLMASMGFPEFDFDLQEVHCVVNLVCDGPCNCVFFFIELLDQVVHLSFCMGHIVVGSLAS